MTLKYDIVKLAKSAKEASWELATFPIKKKNDCLLAMVRELKKNASFILKENKKDINTAKKLRLSNAFIDRLTLNLKRLEGMSISLKEIAKLPDSVGEITKMWKRPNGLDIGKMCVPIGVIGIIYESRPNVTSDCAGLCLKSGNAVLLKGGKEAINSNLAIYKVLNEAGEKAGMPAGSINFIESTDRKAVQIMLSLNKYIDLIIPRGGESLIKEVVNKSKIPVIKHYKGVCHIFVDELAELKMAEKVCFNAKVQRPGTCNAMETLLVHEKVAAKFLPGILKKFKKVNVEIRGCSKTKKIFSGIKLAKIEDFYTEYLDLILSVKVVSSLNDAIAHIRKYGSLHSDAIITKDYNNAWRFLKEVDSACVYVNASTRLTDGGEFGLGTEIGVSTDKIHARGPMGLEELTTYKYIIFGNGQIRM